MSIATHPTVELSLGRTYTAIADNVPVNHHQPANVVGSNIHHKRLMMGKVPEELAQIGMW